MAIETKEIISIKLDPQEIPYYSSKDIAYQTLDKRYEGYYNLAPNLESFGTMLNQRKQFPVDRKLLVSEIRNIYEGTITSSAQTRNISALLEENTFTVVTAHQPSLFTGPLYYIYKICSTIKLTKLLSQRYPDSKFVPVFISGSEDHDFDEVNHCHLFNKKIEWNENAGGAVGRMPLDGLDDVVETFCDILGNSDTALKIKELLISSLNSSSKYKDFNFHIVNNLFEDYGLVVLDMDRPNFKARFKDLMRLELETSPSEKLVLDTQQKLEESGISSQAHPRDVNLFYLKDNYRVRITKEGDNYRMVDTEIVFTKEQIINELNTHPERFSPNVIMRPLYQETILPNLAYIGGGGEIAYWLERRSQFEYFKVSYPILVRRNSALLIDRSSNKQLEKLGLKAVDLLPPVDNIINEFLKDNVDIEIDLTTEKEELDKIFNSIGERAETVDPTINKWIQAEKTKQLKIIDQMGSRIKRALKQKEEIKVNQIQKVKDKLFPGNGLQERHDNFFQYASNYGLDLIDVLIEHFDPLENRFQILYL